MKAVCIGVLVMAFGLSATLEAFAKPNKVNKAGSTLKSGKIRGNAPGAKKNSSCINGTDIHRKQ
jgi:hypothetical protein